MNRTRTRLAVVAAAATLVLGACGNADSGGDSGKDVKAESDVSFDAGTTMADLNKAGKIRIGVKFDQPGIGFKAAGSDAPAGFDIEMGKIIASKLGIDSKDIEWTETISDNREPFLQNDRVDIVLASYSITDERRQVVGQAGPYFVTGQQLLVTKDNTDIKEPEDVKGKEVCSVTGSTSIETVEKEFGAKPRGFDTYTECIDQLKNGSIDAVTTDGAILLGYAAEDPDNLKVVGREFSEERIGVGYKKDDADMCEFLTKTIKDSFDDGSWADAFESTLGESGADTPEPPTPDACA